MNCRGDEDIDAKRSRPSIGKPVMGHARKERVVLFGTDHRITSGPAAKRPHSKAEYMTAPERFADSQIPLAPRAPSTQVTRIGLTFLGTTAFCLLSLLSPDSALLGGNERINVPLAGPVSFFGFMLLGPTVLIVLRAYL